MNGAIGKRDNVTRAAAGTMRVVGPLVPPESGKVGVRVAVKAEEVVRIQDETFVVCCLEILGNLLYKGALVGKFWVKGETSTLVNGVGNIWT